MEKFEKLSTVQMKLKNFLSTTFYVKSINLPFKNTDLDKWKKL